MTSLKYHLVLIGIHSSKNNHHCTKNIWNHILSMKMPDDDRMIHCLDLIDIFYFKSTCVLSLLKKFFIPPIKAWKIMRTALYTKCFLIFIAATLVWRIQPRRWMKHLGMFDKTDHEWKLHFGLNAKSTLVLFL